MDSQIKKGFIEFCILLIISRGRAYTSDMLEILTEANLIVVEGTLYPLLSRLRRDALVTYEWEESPNGPPRKYYSLTNRGREKLASYKDAWQQLEKSIHFLLSKYE